MKCFHWCGCDLSLGEVSILIFFSTCISMFLCMILYASITNTPMRCIIVLYTVSLIVLLLAYMFRRAVRVYLNPDVDFVTKSHVMECIRKRDAMYVSNPSSLGFLKTKIFFLNREEYRLVRRAVARAESKKVKNSITRHSLKK